MKKIAAVTLLLASFIEAKIITIIDNGIERKIAIPSTSNGISARMIETQKKSIIIAFKKGVNIDLEAFSRKYKIKLEKKLSIGYYIFQNKSTLSDIELVSTIQKENKNRIKTIRPNWGFHNTPR